MNRSETPQSRTAFEWLGHPELCQNGTLLVTRRVWRVGGGGMEREGWGKGAGKVGLAYCGGTPPVCHFGTPAPSRLNSQSQIATPKSPASPLSSPVRAWPTLSAAEPGEFNRRERKDRRGGKYFLDGLCPPGDRARLPNRLVLFEFFAFSVVRLLRLGLLASSLIVRASCAMFGLRPCRCLPVLFVCR